MKAEAEIERVIDELFDAWNRGDGAGFARLFTRDADYVTGDGVWLRGRAEIEGLVRTAGAGGKASRVGPPSIRAMARWATAVFRWRGPAAEGRGSRGVVTCVFVRNRGRWLVHRLQNTDETNQ